jgi:hypothetical protein
MIDPLLWSKKNEPAYDAYDWGQEGNPAKRRSHMSKAANARSRIDETMDPLM